MGRRFEKGFDLSAAVSALRKAKELDPKDEEIRAELAILLEEDANGVRHAMVGLLGHSTSFARRRLTLGYRVGHLRATSAIGVAGETVRGHEFHYSVMLDAGSDEPLVDLFDAQNRALGPAGGRRGNVSGTYFHAIAEMRTAPP